MINDFATAFHQVDQLFLTDIYPAGEAPIPGVSGERLADAIRKAGGPPLTYVPRKDQLVETVIPTLKAGDLVLTLGAGDITKIGKLLVQHLG